MCLGTKLRSFEHANWTWSHPSTKIHITASCVTPSLFLWRTATFATCHVLKSWSMAGQNPLGDAANFRTKTSLLATAGTGCSTVLRMKGKVMSCIVSIPWIKCITYPIRLNESTWLENSSAELPINILERSLDGVTQPDIEREAWYEASPS